MHDSHDPQRPTPEPAGPQQPALSFWKQWLFHSPAGAGFLWTLAVNALVAVVLALAIAILNWSEGAGHDPQETAMGIFLALIIGVETVAIAQFVYGLIAIIVLAIMKNWRAAGGVLFAMCLTLLLGGGAFALCTVGLMTMEAWR